MSAIDSVTTSSQILQILRCPACGGEFEAAWRCVKCGREFSSTLGIPDLRWPQVEDTAPIRLVVNDLLEAYAQTSFETLCRVRLARLVTSNELDRHYTQYRLNNLERGVKMARMFQQRATARYQLLRREIALDIGCGSGAAALALSGDFATVVGLDWNLADLLLFRKRLEELNISNVILAQANFLQQPVASNTVDYATALNVIEHMLNVERGFSEIARVLRAGGIFCGDSRNRFDVLFPEPHVKLRGVGFLPREWAKRYVGWRRGLPYENTRLLSYWELRGKLSRHFGSYRIVYPDITAYGASVRTGRWLEKFEARFGRLAHWLLPFFTTSVAIGQKQVLLSLEQVPNDLLA